MASSTSAAAKEGAAKTNGASGANGASASETFDVHRPTDGGVIASLPIDSPERVAEVAAELRAAQPAWEALGIDGRYRKLGEFREWLYANRTRIADILQEETGKVRADAESEVPFLQAEINYYGKHAAEFLAEEFPAPSLPIMRVKKLEVVYRPHQLVGIISPWNFPILLSLGDAMPALIAGATVMIKPSEFTPLAVTEIIRGWHEEVGMPDVLRVVNGLGETGGAVVDQSDYVQFTGSERTGKVVMKRAAETLTPVSLELGGKDPMIVLSDADIERAANGAAFGGLANTGQICMSIERVYVEEPVYDEFVQKLTERVATLRQGADGDTFKADLGAMATPAQAEIVSDQVEDARDKGARILTGGKRPAQPGGQWYEATVIADADHSMKVMTEETFGPVIPVMKVKDSEEAIRLANDTRYGLSASVMTTDFNRGVQIAKRLEVGAVNVDDVLTNYTLPELPMGGWKQSGIGTRHGAYGIRKYCQSESIVSPRFKQGKADPLWFPHGKAKRRGMLRVLQLINGRGIRSRLGL